MVDRPDTLPPPVPADRVSPPIDASELFPDPPEEPTTVSSVPFQLSTDHGIRAAAVEELQQAYRDVVELKELTFAVLIGEPGMGKTYTAERFLKKIGKGDDAPRLLRGEGDGSGAAYGAFNKLLASRFGLTASDSTEQAQEKILTAVSSVLQPARVTEVAHLLANLCRVPFADSPVVTPLLDKPQQLETRTYIAMRRLLSADAGKHPLILCLDNLELCGPETINLLRYLEAGLASQPVMILGTARKSIFKRHPSFGEGEVPLRTIELGPLTTEESTSLLRSLCKQLDEIPPVLLEHATKLGGSPRAIFELLRLLLESEVIVRSGSLSWRIDPAIFATLNLPTSHEELVAERVRVMAGVESDILEKASAVGETFWLDAVVSMVRVGTHRAGDPDGPTLAQIAAAGDHSRVLVAQTLGELVEREWIVQVDDTSMAGEREYRFAYPYLWSCVYENLDAKRRQHYHKLAAQWLQLRPESDLERHSEAIARHLEVGGDARGAAQSYRRAAESARRRFSNDKAISLYGHALNCLGDTDLAARIHLWHDLGSVFEHKGDLDSALGAFESMLRLAWTSASRTKAAVAFNKMGRVWRRKGDLDLALEYLRRAKELFEQAADTAGIASSLDDIGTVLYLVGDYDEAFAHVTEGLARRGKRGDQRSIAHSLSSLGNIQKDRGRFSEAENCHRDALGIRRSIGDRAGIVTSLNNLALLACERGDFDDARRGWADALHEAEDLGSLPLQALALANLGELARTTGHQEEARRRLMDALAIATDLRDPRLSSEANRNLALIEHAHGDAEKARDYAKKANKIAVEAGLRDNQGRTFLTLGEVYAGTLFDASEIEEHPTHPEMKAAARYFSKGIKVLREIGNDSELAKGLARFGRYKIENDEVAAGSTLLREALAIFERLGMKQQHSDVEELLAAL